ncbi:hypothetical protein VKT23_011790 [Stygiomarasmius scandens]|uniref:F-box domain-containing protein n=1 Tax=Marasmiellus scandens TaxID=2682957 RepID=A0ABR1JCN7_9AGAR
MSASDDLATFGLCSQHHYTCFNASTSPGRSESEVDSALSATVSSVFSDSEQTDSRIDRSNEPECLVSGLPPEILAEIFYSSCESHLGIPPLAPHPAFILSHICSSWRSISLSLPKLWSYIEIRVTEAANVSPDRIESLLFFARLFLTRSQSSPLDIILHIPASEKDLYVRYRLYEALQEVDYLPLYGLFFEESARWRSMSLSGFDEDWHANFTWPVNLPIIERLELEAVYNPSFSADGITFANLSAPRLQELTLIGDWNTALDDIPSFPALSQLILCPSIPEYVALELSVLRLATALTAVKIVGFQFICHPGGEPLIRCCAKSLELRPVPLSEAQLSAYRLIGYLDLPHLREIHFEPELPEGPEFDGEIRALNATRQFLSSMEHINKQNITHLTLHHLIFENSRIFLDFLAEFLALTHLSFDERYDELIQKDPLLDDPDENYATTVLSTPEFYQKLNIAYSGYILPKLEVVDLVADYPDSVPGVELMSMLESRCLLGDVKGTATLQRFRLAICNDQCVFGDQIVQRMKRMQAQGLDFQIVFYAAQTSSPDT